MKASSVYFTKYLHYLLCGFCLVHTVLARIIYIGVHSDPLEVESALKRVSPSVLH